MSKLNAILSKTNSGVTANVSYAKYGTATTLVSLSSAVNFTKDGTTVLTFTAPMDGEYRIDLTCRTHNSDSTTGTSTSYSSIVKIRLRAFSNNTTGGSGNVLDSPLDQMFLGSSDPYISRTNGYIPANGSVSQSLSSLRAYLRGGMSYAITAQSGSYSNLSGTVDTLTVRYIKS